MENQILKVLAGLLAVNTDWGDKRRELEKRYSRWVWKYWLFVGVPLVILAAAITGHYFRLLPYETYAVIMIVAGVFSVFAAFWFGRYGRELRAERDDSNRLLGGRIPVAVAAYKMKTLPRSTLLFIRAGGPKGWPREVLIEDKRLDEFLRGLFTKDPGLSAYILVGCWEVEDVDSVCSVKRKEKKIHIWTNHTVGIRKVTFPNPGTAFWAGLEWQEELGKAPHG